ncbi:unnamed protein product [Caenorhabditis angaria]|uniref:Uncharacterized protein n=1 Tax=Caenorhabditis angaria TaxID=860376 RepID=A0A9P1ISZ7_9PELO|nr:unnamed protein product [Caenorhabditis angaria]
MSFWEIINNCLVLCDAPDNFEQLFDVLEYHRLNFIDRYRLILWILGVGTNLIVISTIYFICRVKSAVDRSYRNIILMNIILPCLFTNYICFIWQPYSIAPYFMFFVVGPIVVDHFVTGICMIVWVNLMIPFVYSLISQLNYHFFIVVYPSKIL